MADRPSLIDPSEWDLANANPPEVPFLDNHCFCPACGFLTPLQDMTPAFEPLCMVCGKTARPTHTTSAEPSDATKYDNALRLQRARRHPRPPQR